MTNAIRQMIGWTFAIVHGIICVGLGFVTASPGVQSLFVNPQAAVLYAIGMIWFALMTIVCIWFAETD